jgi:hypothetical protein
MMLRRGMESGIIPPRGETAEKLHEIPPPKVNPLGKSIFSTNLTLQI